MAYNIEIYPEVGEQIRALPRAALPGLAEAMTVLEVTPWSGEPQHAGNREIVAIRRIRCASAVSSARAVRCARH